MRKGWDDPIEHAMPPAVRVPDEVVIGGVRIAPATVLAPMAGVTDTVFRRFIRNASVFSASSLDPTLRCAQDGATDLFDQASPALRCAQDGASDGGGVGVLGEVTNQQSGCGLIMTEFTSADGIARMRESKRKRYLGFYEDEHPIAAQLFGSDPVTMAEAARVVEDSGFDIVDLNLGCPAKQVCKSNGGSGLLRDLPHIRRLFEAVRSAVKIPFTVKFRLGWSDDRIVCVELARMAQECGLNAVALHARTREQGYSGQARWEWIAAVKDAVDLPVIGNGDVRTPEDACALVAKTGCDAVMIGRAAPVNPWIFRQIAQYNATGSYEQPTERDRYAMIRAYFAMLVEEEMQGAIGKMKQFATWFTYGVVGGAALRKAIYEAKQPELVLGAVDEFFAARVDAGGSPLHESSACAVFADAGCGD